MNRKFIKHRDDLDYEDAEALFSEMQERFPGRKVMLIGDAPQEIQDQVKSQIEEMEQTGKFKPNYFLFGVKDQNRKVAVLRYANTLEHLYKSDRINEFDECKHFETTLDIGCDIYEWLKGRGVDEEAAECTVLKILHHFLEKNPLLPIDAP